MFRVLECQLHDMDEGTLVEEFHTRWEAEKYVDNNEEHANDFGYTLFIEGDDDEEV